MSTADAQQRVLAKIESWREQIIGLTQEVVRIPSVAPNYLGVDSEQYLGLESQVNRRLRTAFNGCFDILDLFEGAPQRENLVGVLRGAGGGRSLIFNGHIDVVPPGAPEAWKWNDPFSGRIEDGRLYGRGATDMKGGVVATLFAARALRECGIRLKGDLMVESVCGEETGEHEVGTTATIRRGYKADAAVVVEPSGPPESLAINPADPGFLWLEITVDGKATHASARREFVRAGGQYSAIGINAVEKGVLVVQALQKLEDTWGFTKQHPVFPPGQFTIHPGVIHGRPYDADWPAVVADYCKIQYIIWYPPQETGEAIQAEIEQYVLTAAKLDPWLAEHPPRFNWIMDYPPYDTAPDHPIVGAVARSYRQVLDKDPLVTGFIAACDATWLQRVGGIPVSNCGPGNLLVAHAANEYVEVEDIIRATKIYALTAMDWCGVA